MSELPICECAVVWPGDGHHLECPVRRRIVELEAENQQLREAATAVIAERNYVRGDTALEFLIDKLESALLGGGE